MKTILRLLTLLVIALRRFETRWFLFGAGCNHVYSTNKIIRTVNLIGAIVLVTFALSPTSRAVDPPPDGGYPDGNTAEGEDALFNLNFGSKNTAIGFEALYENTKGNDNTANGFRALYANTIGGFNTATGVQALFLNNGSFNTANGAFALFSNKDGSNNTANGNVALFYNTTGSYNTATGEAALAHNRNGFGNTANGTDALYSNTSGHENTATGAGALQNNTTGNTNAANGFNALYLNTTGKENTAEGQNALKNNTAGSNNVALGSNAGISLTTGSNNIEIGNRGLAGEANTIRIGTEETQTATFIAGISGVAVAGGVGVVIDTNGQLGTVVSSARFKDAIKPMDKESEAILALKPVTFRYKHELDPEGIPQFGLVAEQVETVNPDLVARDEKGKAYTVRYEAVNAMLLNEFLKEHRKVEEQGCKMSALETTIAQQKKEFRATVEQQQEEITALTTALKAQAAQIQNVSEQLRTAKPAPRLASNQE